MEKNKQYSPTRETFRRAAPAQERAARPVEWERAARTAAGLDRRDSCPVVVVAGTAAPVLEGHSYHWRTPAGDLVRYPSAYSRAFGRPVYHPSTRRVVVGEGWRPSPRSCPCV